MEISPIRQVGLADTAAAIKRGMTRFDEHAQRVADDTLALSSGEASTAEASSQLPADLVGLKADSIANSILFAVFRSQQETHAEAADLLRRE